MNRIDIHTVIYLIGLFVVLGFIFRFLWPLLLIAAVYLLYRYLQARHFIKKAEAEMQKQLEENNSLEEQFFHTQVNEAQKDVIDAEYVEHEEQH